MERVQNTMATGTLVTFNENVDTYVRGDTVRLSADELKRVDAYAKRWKIESPYKKGSSAPKGDEAKETAKRTVADAAKASQGDVEKDDTTSIETATATAPEGDGGEQAAMTVGEVENDDKATEPANNTVNPGGDTSDSEPAKTDEGSAEATVLPEDEGKAAKAKK